MYFAETPEHRIGARVVELASRCGQRGDAKLMAVVALPDSRECVIAVHRPTPARKPDPSAP